MKDLKDLILDQPYLQDGPVEEERQKLYEVIDDVSIFLLHSDDVWRVVGFIPVHLRVLVEGEKAKLAEVLDDDGDLEEKTCKQNPTIV